MPAIFCNPGRVVALNDTACYLPITVALGCWGAGTVFRAIITQVGVHQHGGFQFMHTLRDKIYMYIFGERIGELTVSGVTFTGGCATGYAGIEAVIGYYHAARATRRYSPLSVTVGSLSFSAFLMEVRTDITNPEMGLGSFTMRFYFPPVVGSSSSTSITCSETGTTPGCLSTTTSGSITTPSAAASLTTATCLPGEICLTAGGTVAVS